MLRLAKAFWELALWRMSPAQLPASLFLLGMVSCIVALLEVMGALLPPASTEWITTRIALSVGLPLAWTWAVLVIARHRERFLQTAIALLGIGALRQIVMYPLDSLLQSLGSLHPIATPLVFALLVGLVWYMLACANVWRAALNSGLVVGVAVSIGYLAVSILLEQSLIPES